MSASKYRCSFQLSVKGSRVCINAVFCAAITTQRWDVIVAAACINQLCCRPIASGSSRLTYCYLCLGKLAFTGDATPRKSLRPGPGRVPGSSRVEAGIPISSRVAPVTFTSDRFQQGARQQEEFSRGGGIKGGGGNSIFRLYVR